MRRVIMESPFAGNVERNLKYAHACIRDCLSRDEAPFASHVLYTQALDDNDMVDRARGITAGLEWGVHARKTVVYTDLGISQGMKIGIEHAKHLDREVEYRSLGAPWVKYIDE